jgi:hypothetical protein
VNVGSCQFTTRRSGALELAATDRARAIAPEALGDDHEAIFHGHEAVAAWQDALSILRSDPACDQDLAR